MMFWSAQCFLQLFHEIVIIVRDVEGALWSIGTKPPSSISLLSRAISASILALPCVSAVLSTPPKRRRSRPNFFRTAVHSGLNFPRIQNVNARIDPGLNQKIDIAVAIQREESPRALARSITFLCRPGTLMKARLIARLV